MADEIINLPSDTQNIEYYIVTLFEKLDTLRRESASVPTNSVGHQKPPMQVEIRTLEFWRSIISECLASFFYVFIVCGAAVGAGPSLALVATSLAAGFAMTTMTQCFGHISGAHVNPAVTVAMAITRNISPLRAAMFITAQCGGGIAGAALLYGVSVPTYHGNLSVLAHSSAIPAWERFGVEFVLTFMVVFTYFVSMDTYRKWMGSSALAIGAAYSACTFVSIPYLNPARSLGPSFVLNKWDNQWVYWIAPLVGGATSGFLYEFIFNPRRHIRRQKTSIDGDSSSIHSDEDTYDDLDKPASTKFHGSTYNTYRPAGASGGPASTSGPGGYCTSVASASLYSAPPTKLERVESLYGGTKSLYCKSPPLTRANLNRSQSVYAKSNTAINRDIIPRPGPLVPAQSLYPMRLNQQQQTTSHVQNQNVQNQMQQRSESAYGIRPLAPGMASRTDGAGVYTSSTTPATLYGTRSIPSGSETAQKYEDGQKYRSNRPESMYGMVSGQPRRPGQSTQSDDSSYGSYHGSNTTPRQAPTGNFSTAATYGTKTTAATQPGYNSRQAGGNEIRQSPPTQLLSSVSNSNSFHHPRPQQHSPSSQY